MNSKKIKCKPNKCAIVILFVIMSITMSLVFTLLYKNYYCSNNCCSKLQVREIAPPPHSIDAIDAYWKNLYDIAKNQPEVKIQIWTYKIKSAKPIWIDVILATETEEVFVGRFFSCNKYEENLEMDFTQALRKLKSPPNKHTSLKTFQDDSTTYNDIGIDVYK